MFANVGIFGQSFAQALYGSAAQGVFKHELAREGITPRIVYSAWGGSSVLKANVRTDQPTWYWWDETTNGPGPLLSSAEAAIVAAAHKPDQIFMLIGEQDAAKGNALSLWEWAIKSVIWRLKQACNASNPTSVEAYIDIIGRRGTGFAQEMREAQLSAIATSSIDHLCDKHDIVLLGKDPLYRWGNDFHFMTIGDAVLGFRVAQHALNYAGKSAVFPPAGAVSRTSSTTVDVVLPAGLVKPTNPEGFAIRDGSVVYGATSLTYSWAGDTLTISAPAALAPNAKLLYPYGNLASMARTGLIRDSMGTPLKSMAATF